MLEEDSNPHLEVGDSSRMIARLRGLLAHKGIDRVIVDCGGVGYDVQVSIQTHNALPEEGEEATLHIQTNIREDTFDLLGFATFEERDMFRLLITISGIGPRMALNLLSHITPVDLVDTIRRENIKGLTAIPGIGKRKAERMIVELRDKMIDIDLGMSASDRKQVEQAKAVVRDLHSALLNFGYRAAEVDKVIAMLEPEIEAGVELEQLVLLGLQKLSKL